MERSESCLTVAVRTVTNSCRTGDNAMKGGPAEDLQKLQEIRVGLCSCDSWNWEHVFVYNVYIKKDFKDFGIGSHHS